jgi:hypothetical protein
MTALPSQPEQANVLHHRSRGQHACVRPRKAAVLELSRPERALQTPTCSSIKPFKGFQSLFKAIQGQSSLFKGIFEKKRLFIFALVTVFGLQRHVAVAPRGTRTCPRTPKPSSILHLPSSPLAFGPYVNRCKPMSSYVNHPGGGLFRFNALTFNALAAPKRGEGGSTCLRRQPLPAIAS